MSSSIAIPKRKKPAGHAHEGSSFLSSSSSSSLSSSMNSPQTPQHSSSTAASSPSDNYLRERRTSLLGPSISRSEYTVINVGQPDAPRLITCVRSAQGFDWNQEIFLPSYCDHYYDTRDLERKQDPVHEIIVTDEEIARMFP